MSQTTDLIAKLQYIQQNKYLVGFEVECITTIPLSIFRQKLKQIHSKISIALDYSVRTKEGWNYDDAKAHHSTDTPIEVRTPALSVIKSLEVLENVFALLKQHGYTNKSCGLHLNISPISNKKYYKINPFYLSSLSVWEDMKKQFHRDTNCFCAKTPVKSQTPLNFISLWKRLQSGNLIFNNNGNEHYHVINFQSFHPVRKRSSRIEVRAMGNANYHTRFKRVLENVETTIQQIEKSMEVQKIFI